MDATFNILETFLGSNIAALVIAVIALVLAAWYLSKTLQKIRHKLESIDQLPCSEHTSSIAAHNEGLASLSATLKSVDSKIEMLIKLIPLSGHPKEPLLSDDIPALSQKRSPKVLNPNGRLIEDIFKTKDFVSVNKDWLLDALASFNPKTALDVEIFSLAALRVSKDDTRFNSIKDAVYQSPAVELTLSGGEKKLVEISLEDVLFVISLELRDEYLSRHPELLPKS